jgi:hypothetical protein
MMRRYLTTLSLLLALLLCGGVAWGQTRVGCGISQPCPVGGGVTITTEATYSDLVTAGCITDGDIGYTEDQDLYWVCNTATGLWLPPDVQPASIDIVDYTADALPADATPAWTRTLSGSDQSEAVSGGALTNTDGGNGYIYYTLASDSIVSTNNVAVLARMKLTATDATTSTLKCLLAIHTSGGYVGTYSFSLGMSGDALSRANAIAPLGASYTYSDTSSSPDNAAYQWYMVKWNATAKTYSFMSLGHAAKYELTVKYFGTTFPIPHKNVAFGHADSGRTITSMWDRVMVFTY